MNYSVHTVTRIIHQRRGRWIFTVNTRRYLSPLDQNVEHCQPSRTLPGARFPVILLSERSNILSDDHVVLAVVLSAWLSCPSDMPRPFAFQALPYFWALQSAPGLHCICSRPSCRSSHFSKKLWFLLAENGTGKPRFGCRVCSLLLECHSF